MTRLRTVGRNGRSDPIEAVEFLERLFLGILQSLKIGVASSLSLALNVFPHKTNSSSRLASTSV
jgi:hypothetical protein